ncbi:MAG TPA: hypothetical protein VGH02_06510 [Rhizomicrobium sp.]|jgi:hypothetical protein
MPLVKPFANTSSAAVPVVWKGTARVEKVRLSNTLDGERRDAPQRRDFASAKSARASLSRNETIEALPERRLVPTFVTQVLAQAMPGQSADLPSALQAYRSGATKIALVYDRDL